MVPGELSSSCAISNATLMLAPVTVQGVVLPGFAVLYSGWKANGLVAHVTGFVFTKPLPVLATIEPLVNNVASVTTPDSPLGVSMRLTTTRSPGCIPRG